MVNNSDLVRAVVRAVYSSNPQQNLRRLLSIFDFDFSLKEKGLLFPIEKSLIKVVGKDMVFGEKTIARKFFLKRSLYYAFEPKGKSKDIDKYRIKLIEKILGDSVLNLIQYLLDDYEDGNIIFDTRTHSTFLKYYKEVDRQTFSEEELESLLVGTLSVSDHIDSVDYNLLAKYYLPLRSSRGVEAFGQGSAKSFS